MKKSLLEKIVKELENPCWKGYEMVGMKDKDGKQVPNCVPVSEVAYPPANLTKKSKTNQEELKRVESLLSWAHKNNQYSTMSSYETHIMILKFLVKLEKELGKKLPLLPFGVDFADYLKKELKYKGPVKFSRLGGLKNYDDIYNTLIQSLKEAIITNECWQKEDELECDDNGNCWEAEPPHYQSTSMGYREMNESDCGCSEQQIEEGNCDCDEAIEEYDVETIEEYKDFSKFIREYTSLLSEATCPCLLEAEYQGRTVKLGKPMQGDVKKFKVYVKNDKGNVVKVNFGDPNMRIKKSNPERRKSFRARHHCDSPGPRWKARYWSCRKW